MILQLGMISKRLNLKRICNSTIKYGKYNNFKSVYYNINNISNM